MQEQNKGYRCTTLIKKTMKQLGSFHYFKEFLSGMLIVRNSSISYLVNMKNHRLIFCNIHSAVIGILAAFVNEIKVSFLLLVKYHVRNICTNFKQKL